jgi:hypothetical protein
MERGDGELGREAVVQVELLWTWNEQGKGQDSCPEKCCELVNNQWVVDGLS